jgi:hypothetical protein
MMFTIHQFGDFIENNFGWCFIGAATVVVSSFVGAVYLMLHLAEACF